jgi:hypothetical protein
LIFSQFLPIACYWITIILEGFADSVCDDLNVERCSKATVQSTTIGELPPRYNHPMKQIKGMKR